MASLPDWMYMPQLNASALENAVVVDKDATKRNQQQKLFGVTPESEARMKVIAEQYQAKQNKAAQATQQTETKAPAQKEDPFLEGFDDPYGEKREQEKLRKEQERKERLAKIRENADKRTWSSQNTTDLFLDGFNGTSNEQRVKFPNTQLQSKPLMFPNTQLQASQNKKADIQFSKTDPFVEGFNDPHGEKEKEEKSKWQKVLDGISTGLTAASIIPGLDTFTNIAQIPVDLLRGDFVGAGLDLVGAIPFVGEIADILNST